MPTPSHTELPSLMEPMLPDERSMDELVELAFDLLAEANRLAGTLNPTTRLGVSELVRKMNCYYSNLIEGNHTHPRAIDRALSNEDPGDGRRRDLVREAFAHIRVQTIIDGFEERRRQGFIEHSGGFGMGGFGMGTFSGATRSPLTPAAEWDEADEADLEEIPTARFLKWAHRRFYAELPDEMRRVSRASDGRISWVQPGAYRAEDVEVGVHVPPHEENLERFMGRFEEAYGQLYRNKAIVACAAAHHRLAWIHPFLDGNGRVARLFSHAWLQRLGAGNPLWSVSRGLARSQEEYKRRLAECDQPRRGELDGRGSLSQAALVDFCRYFLETALDQVRFMERLLALETLLGRIEHWCAREVRERRLPDRSYELLREALMAGQVERGSVTRVTGFRDRKARAVLYALERRKLLIAGTSRGPVRLGFPAEAAEEWFPSLFPAEIA